MNFQSYYRFVLITNCHTAAKIAFLGQRRMVKINLEGKYFFKVVVGNC